jgi:murein L,D-transpeptidase YcbB/YkuD
LGDLNSDTTQTIYDENLEAAIKSFQARHGLEADGIIGKSVIDALNIPLSKRIEQIVVNMERLRWMPRSFSTESNYLLVNIPEFMLHVYENNKKQWDCNVVVGERENKTVIFTGTLKYIVFSPHWNVPESIVKEEILPEIEKDPTYLEKQELEITGERNGTPVIRQKPGSENSLGLVKFMFPNTHNIYLHDSPAKELFKENTRAFSHGCIRVSEPVELATYLLREDPSWDQSKIIEAMNTGEEKYVTLKNKVPVYITYFTAWVDDEGRLNFRKDIYDNDARLARMILKSQEAATAMVK